MTTLRALAVIGFLLASRLKDVSFSELQKRWKQGPGQSQEPQREPAVAPQIDYNALATALVGAMQQAGAIDLGRIVEQGTAPLPSLNHGVTQQESLEVKLARAYKALKEERDQEPNLKPISARELAKRANVRRSTCTEWLQQHEANPLEEEGQSFHEIASPGENIP